MPGHHIQIPDAGTDSASHFGIHHPEASRINLHNPLPLSAAQEAQVKDLYYKRVRKLCDPEIKEFAACMVANARPEEEDKAREEWFKGIQERRRKKEEESIEVEKRRQEVIDMTRRKAEQEKAEAESKKVVESKKSWW
ncbi:hypothetical protein LTS08_002858 [Lithohypha guttulata]|nr:hypothetical protein LTS08_002858 [Lithohypha guttulata]